MTKQNLAWCFQHDWCQNGVLNENGTITIYPFDYLEPVVTFKTMSELKAWAGY